MKTLLGKQLDDFSLVVKISDDKLKLYIDIEPVKPVSIEVDLLKSMIAEVAPQADLHHDVLLDVRRVVASGEKVLERRVAKGKAAESGADGKLLLLVKPLSGKGEVQLDERGYAKFDELHLFDNIEIGQHVARIYAPKPGQDGFDALGARIVGAPGKPVKVTLEKGLQRGAGPGAEYEIVTAQLAGYLNADGLRLAMHEELRIQGDLDLKFGNIQFIGSVKVSGEVGAGLTIQAKRDIEVGGAREARLISKEGKVTVRGFLFGGDGGRVEAAAGFHGSVVHKAKIETQGDICVDREALDCVLRSQSYIRIAGGRCVGGDVYVVKAAEAKEWGNEAGLRTSLHLSSDVEARAEYTDILKQRARLEQAIELIKLHLGPFATNPTRIQHLKEPHKAKMMALILKLTEIQRALGGIENKRNELLSTAQGAEGLRVNVVSCMHAGVVIDARELKFAPTELVAGPKSIFPPKPEQTEFQLLDLQPLPALEKK